MSKHKFEITINVENDASGRAVVSEITEISAFTFFMDTFGRFGIVTVILWAVQQLT